MLSFFPRFVFAAPAGDARGMSYFGGLPTGLPSQQWPICAECDTPLTFLFQLGPGPHAPRIPHDQVAMIFTCETDEVCDFWSHDSGANAVLLRDIAGLGTQPTTPPASLSEYSTAVLTRAWVADWAGTGTAATAEEIATFDDPDAYVQLDESVVAPYGYEFEHATRTGDVPLWTADGPTDEPPLPRRFVFQIAVALRITDAPEGEEYLSEANFMSDGRGFLFDTRPDDARPVLAFEMSR